MIKEIKKWALIAGLAGTMTGCYSDSVRTVVAPDPVVSPVILTPQPVILTPQPVILKPAYRPMWWGPRFHHHYHGRWHY